MLPLAIGIVTAVAWAYLLLGRGGFWRVREPAAAAPRKSHQWIAAVIPARDEAAVIGDSVASLLQQTWPGGLHIFVVDDGSTDGTAVLARRVAEAAGHSDRLTVITGSPVPPGWTGKLWAMQQGIEAALKLKPTYVLLTDADIGHAADSIATLVAVAERGRYDLTSLMVRLRCESVAEKLLIPAFVFFFFMLYPPAWVANGRRRTAGAAGGCMLIRAATLARLRGLTGIRNEVIDDCALARAVKRSGGHVWLGVSSGSQSLRAYESFAAIGRMIARTAFNQLRHSTVLLVVAVLGMAVVYLAPVALLLTPPSLPFYLGAAACAAMVLCYLPMVSFYGLNVLWALTLPLAALFYVGATTYSAVMFWTGRGGAWKGRVQDPAAGEPANTPQQLR
jgi:hopene-associated glycosyltransferase HpnB